MSIRRVIALLSLLSGGSGCDWFVQRGLGCEHEAISVTIAPSGPSCQFFPNFCPIDPGGGAQGWHEKDAFSLVDRPDVYVNSTRGSTPDEKWQICVAEGAGPFTNEELPYDYASGPGKVFQSGVLVLTTIGVSGISGTVGLPGVTVALTGDRTASTVSNTQGFFSFTVPDGSYVVTPSPGALPYRFDPPSVPVVARGGGSFFVQFAPIFVPALIASASANPDIVPIGGRVNLSATTTGGVGPLSYQWRGYRDDGAPFSYTLGNGDSANPTADLVNPGTDFFFFVHVTDNGVSAGAPGHDAEAVVRVHETDGPVARLRVSPDQIVAGVTDVAFDGSLSNGAMLVEWTLQYRGNIPRPGTLEEYFQTAYTGFYDNVFDPVITTDLLFGVPAATFAGRPGVYRMQLGVEDLNGVHRTMEYFYVDPP